MITITCSEVGRQIDFHEEQRENASASIRISFDPDLNANDESDLQYQKNNSQEIRLRVEGRLVSMMSGRKMPPFKSLKVRS
jgi:hypothetical protein